MNVLILSCNTGGGHNAAARAVAETFRAHGDEAVVLDYLKLAGEKVSRTVGNVYVETVKIAPGLFGLLYKIGMLVSRLLRRSPVYYVNGKMAVYLAAYLKKHPDANVIIKGYASPEGNLEFNKKLAKARAEAVESILVKKYKIDSTRVSAEGQGIGDMFTDPDWNRVSICTIDESK